MLLALIADKMNTLPQYTYDQMKADKKAYGCLDGDWAKKCTKCNGRFTGSPSNLCPHCLNKQAILLDFPPKTK
jgi:rRNA maturation endonuclease Nob1